MLINTLSMMCDFPVEEKQALLEADSLASRRKALEALLNMAVHPGGNRDTMQ